MLDNFSTVAQIIISVAAMLLSGYLMTRITRLLKLPNVTAYIIAGILIGPYCLNVIPQKVTEGMDFIADIALAFIAFGTGGIFQIFNLEKERNENRDYNRVRSNYCFNSGVYSYVFYT